jgi:hypothetical protein
MSATVRHVERALTRGCPKEGLGSVVASILEERFTAVGLDLHANVEPTERRRHRLTVLAPTER